MTHTQTICSMSISNTITCKGICSNVQDEWRMNEWRMNDGWMMSEGRMKDEWMMNEGLMKKWTYKEMSDWKDKQMKGMKNENLIKSRSI